MANKEEITERKESGDNVEGVEKDGVDRGPEDGDQETAPVQAKGKKSGPVINKRKPYYGATITPGNRGKYLELFRNTFYDNIKDKDLYKDKSEEELEKIARLYAKLEVQREQKHLKAWLKGERGYKFKGKYFPVLRSYYTEDVHHSDEYKQRLKRQEELSKEESK